MRMVRRHAATNTDMLAGTPLANGVDKAGTWRIRMSGGVGIDHTISITIGGVKVIDADHLDASGTAGIYDHTRAVNDYFYHVPAGQAPVIGFVEGTADTCLLIVDTP